MVWTGAALEAALTDHITRTTKAPYQKRLKDHLRETKAHRKALERRVKQLGGELVDRRALRRQAAAVAVAVVELVRNRRPSSSFRVYAR